MAATTQQITTNVGDWQQQNFVTLTIPEAKSPGLRCQWGQRLWRDSFLALSWPLQLWHSLAVATQSTVYLCLHDLSPVSVYSRFPLLSLSYLPVFRFRAHTKTRTTSRSLTTSTKTSFPNKTAVSRLLSSLLSLWCRKLSHRLSRLPKSYTEINVGTRN